VGFDFLAYEEGESFIEETVKETIWNVATEGLFMMFGKYGGTLREFVKGGFKGLLSAEKRVFEEADKDATNFWKFVHEYKLYDKYPIICNVAKKHEINSPPFCEEVEDVSISGMEKMKHSYHYYHDTSCALCQKVKLDSELMKIKEEKLNSDSCRQFNDCKLDKHDFKKALMLLRQE
jgi:hypothetical protein